MRNLDGEIRTEIYMLNLAIIHIPTATHVDSLFMCELKRPTYPGGTRQRRWLEFIPQQLKFSMFQKTKCA